MGFDGNIIGEDLCRDINSSTCRLISPKFDVKKDKIIHSGTFEVKRSVIEKIVENLSNIEIKFMDYVDDNNNCRSLLYSYEQLVELLLDKPNINIFKIQWNR